MNKSIEGKQIIAVIDYQDGKMITGTVQLVFNDALASGSNQYVSVTYLMVSDEEGKTHTVKPTDVLKVLTGTNTIAESAGH